MDPSGPMEAIFFTAMGMVVPFRLFTLIYSISVKSTFMLRLKIMTLVIIEERGEKVWMPPLKK